MCLHVYILFAMLIQRPGTDMPLAATDALRVCFTLCPDGFYEKQCLRVILAQHSRSQQTTAKFIAEFMFDGLVLTASNAQKNDKHLNV